MPNVAGPSDQQLFCGLKPCDPMGLAGAASSLVVAAHLASWILARRAAWVEAIQVLRHE
jgi:hypothetical protein